MELLNGLRELAEFAEPFRTLPIGNLAHLRSAKEPSVKQKRGKQLGGKQNVTKKVSLGGKVTVGF